MRAEYNPARPLDGGARNKRSDAREGCTGSVQRACQDELDKQVGDPAQEDYALEGIKCHDLIVFSERKHERPDAARS
jgi:hypothetical protein